MNKKWNAQEYTSNFKFVYKYGEDLLNLLNIENGMKILDLGCGNGALTKRISDMGAAVIGMDSSIDMLEVAKSLYPEISFVHDDAVKFKLSEPVDIVFSNAVFHWIENQNDLLENVSNALKSSGYLVCEFGGYGCVKTIHSALQKAFEKRGLNYIQPFFFPTIGEYAPMLERHNLRVLYAILFDRKTELSGEDGMKEWIKMFITKPFLNLDDAITNEIINETVQDLKPILYNEGTWYADYVRIRIKAQKMNDELTSGC